MNFSLFTGDGFFSCSYDLGCIQAVFLQEVFRCAAFPEGIVGTDIFDGNGVMAGCYLGDGISRPPSTLCSSAVTAQPVLVMDLITAASSSGLMVWMLISSTL